jgi:hypothetical protein
MKCIGILRPAVAGATAVALALGSVGAAAQRRCEHDRHFDRGAEVGGALGAVANGACIQADRDQAYRRAFDDCRDDYRR